MPTRLDDDLAPHDAGEEATASLADYIAELTTELARMAERRQLRMLAYFLDLARVEAELKSKELRSGSTGVDGA
jgi:hypothetical protein